ncbi:tryptophan-rich sensory protein [Microbacterium sp. STN6]|uniref:TspO/MBR family protein n=1 Tax=Microbacterium sp. STN6 TaxID=2995588 RepID=UPI002260FF91|nr:TspO/MBR family protein [Microbacterium sp. STN6]MCX7521399.1 tryptophan-rich sensory protein [Microbacterium sp. STN6]
MFVKKLIVTGTLTAATALVGSVASRGVDSRWYRKLNKPSIQPPREVFPIVWTTLYTGIALASAGVLTARKRAKAAARALNAANAALAVDVVGDVQTDADGFAVSTQPHTSVKASLEHHPTRGYRSALLLNLLLNGGWSWAFFRSRNIPLALAAAAGLAVSSGDLVRRAGRVSPGLGWALVPYAAWCAFATVLTARIRRLNPDA